VSAPADDPGGRGADGVIAEDLGVVPKYVPPFWKNSAFPVFHPAIYCRLRDSRVHPQGRNGRMSIATWVPMIMPACHLVPGSHPRWRGPDGHEAWLDLQRLMRFLVRTKTNACFLTEHLHEAFIRTLLEARSCWTIFTITTFSASIGASMRPAPRPTIIGVSVWTVPCRLSR